MDADFMDLSQALPLLDGKDSDMGVDSVPLLPSTEPTVPENLNSTQDLVSSQNTIEENPNGYLASSRTQIEPILANSTDSPNSSSDIGRSKNRSCSICGMVGHTAANKKFHHGGRTEDEELLEEILPSDINKTLVTKLEGKRGLGSGGVIAKLLKWAKHELGYVPKDLAGSMKLPDRYRLLVSSTEDVEKIANKEFEFETLRFTFKPASEISELPKKRKELVDSVTKQNDGLEYDCRCGDPTPTMAEVGEPVDLRCAVCNKMFHQRCLDCPIPISPLPGDWAYEFLCKGCNFIENRVLADSFSFHIKDSESILLVALYNLHLEAIQERRVETQFFHENEISMFIEDTFEALCYYKPKKSYIGKPMPDLLRQCFQNPEVFKAGQPECWGLVKYENPLLTHPSPRKKPKRYRATKEAKVEDNPAKTSRGEKRKLSEMSPDSSSQPRMSPPATPPSPAPSATSPTSNVSRPPLTLGSSFSSVTHFPPQRSSNNNATDLSENSNVENPERVFSASKVLKKRKLNGKIQYLIQLREEAENEKIRVWFNSEQLSILQNEEETVVIHPPPPPPLPPPPKQQTEDDLQEISAAQMIEGQLNFLVKWKGHETHTFVPAPILNKVAPMAVIQFYESRVSFDKPKSKKESNGTSEKENGNKTKMERDEITTNLAQQLVQQQKLQQQIILQLLQSRPPLKNAKNTNEQAASSTKVVPCTGCNVLLQYHADARQIQCPRCKTTMQLEKSTITIIDVGKS